PRFSPDGKQIVFSSAMGNKLFFASNSRLAVVGVDGGTPRSITDGFDENPGLIEWKSDGVYFAGSQKTASHLFRVDPANGKVIRVSRPDDLIGGSFSFTRAGDEIAFVASSPTSMNEVFVSGTKTFTPRKLTNMMAQTSAFTLG